MGDDRTQAQRDADAALEYALVEVAKAYGFLDEGQALGDWMAFLEIQSFDASLDESSRYVSLFPGGGIPWHRIYGLYVLAGKQLDEQKETE
jgi:hypothetical protein